MGYEILYKSSVRRDLKNIEKSEVDRILSEIERVLSKNPRVGKPLTGKFKGLYRYRIGDYRVIYAVEGKSVWILKIGHRKKVYR